MYLQFHSVKEPSKNHDILLRVVFGSLWIRVGFGSGTCTLCKNYKITLSDSQCSNDLASLELHRLWFDLYWCYFGLVDVHNDHCNLFESKSDCVTSISCLSDTALAT